MGMSRCPNNVFGTKSAVAPEEDARIRGLEGDLVQVWTIPLIKLDAQIPLNPRTMIVLTNRHQHMVTFDKLVRLARWLVAQTTVLASNRRYALKQHALEFAVFVNKFFGWPIVDNRNALAHGILFLPLRCFHHLECRAHHHFHRLGAQAQRRTTAVHGRVTAPHDDNLAFNF